MNNIPIQAVPNQSFGITINNNRFDLSIVETNNSMSATIIVNDQILIQNVKAAGGTFLLPYHYLEHGNFLFFTSGNELIYYPHFGATQSLIYLSPADLKYLRG